MDLFMLVLNLIDRTVRTRIEWAEKNKVKVILIFTGGVFDLAKWHYVKQKYVTDVVESILCEKPLELHCNIPKQCY